MSFISNVIWLCTKDWMGILPAVNKYWSLVYADDLFCRCLKYNKWLLHVSWQAHFQLFWEFINSHLGILAYRMVVAMPGNPAEKNNAFPIFTFQLYGHSQFPCKLGSISHSLHTAAKHDEKNTESCLMQISRVWINPRINKKFHCIWCYKIFYLLTFLNLPFNNLHP